MNKGFTLLVAIITTSLLLVVSFVVVNVALKQLVLSYANQESQFAFYNADSGTECAMYWDLKNPTGISAFATSTASTITCNGQSITSGQSVPTSPSPTTSVVGGGGSSNATSTFSITFPRGCAIVKVGKYADGSTRVESYGYNSCVSNATRRFERGITLSFDSSGVASGSSGGALPTTWSLTSSKSGSGSGLVTGNGINCGSTCNTSLADGTTVTLIATPSGTDTFAGWSGGGCSGTGACSFILTSDTTVSASFTTSSLTLIPQSQISVVSASADLANASLTLDGDENSKWSLPSNNQNIVLNLGGTYLVSGFRYDESWSAIKDYEIYVSTDGSNWGSSVSSGVVSPGVNILFTPTAGSYLKFVDVDNYNGYAYASEFNVYQSGVISGGSAPTVTISASPTSISSGGSSTLTWSSTNATSCTASNGWSGIKATSGSTSVSPSSTATYTLTCTGASGSGNNSTTVTVTGSVTGNIYYISTTGSNTNSGTIGSPFKTLQKAISVMSGGDTIYFRAGTYTGTGYGSGNGIDIPSGTSWSSPTTISAYPGESVTLRPDSFQAPNGAYDCTLAFTNGSSAYIIVQNMIFDGTNCRGLEGIYSGIGTNHLRVQGMEIKNYTTNWTDTESQNGFLGGGSYIELLNNNFHNNGGLVGQPGHGVYFSASDSLVEGNDIHDNYGDGIQVQDSGPGQGAYRNIIRNNRIHNNQAYGGIAAIDGQDNKVYNNIIYNNAGDGIAITPIGGGTPSSDRNWIYNNTMYGNTGNCVIVGAFGTADNDKIINNICYSNGNNSIYVTPGSVTNLTSQNNLFSNPTFVNSGSNDYHLQSSSAAINAGFTLGSPYNIDFDGNSRPSGSAYDIGAYEYGGSVSTPAPTVTISSLPSSISSGGSSTLLWSSTNATSCTASNGWSGSKATSGSTSVSPSSTATYTLTCTGTGGSGNNSTTVTVTGAVSSGNTYYISTTGSNTNSGTIGSPFKTLTKAISTMSGGDTVYFRAGTYTGAGYGSGNGIDIPSGTSWSSPTTISAYPGESVTLKPDGFMAPNAPICTFAFTNGSSQYIIVQNLILDGTNCRGLEGMYLGPGSDHIRIQGMEIKYFTTDWSDTTVQNGILGGGDFDEILNNNIHDNGGFYPVRGTTSGHGIYWSGNDALIDGNDLHDNGGNGIQVQDAGPNAGSYRNIVRNNKIHNNKNFGGIGSVDGQDNKIYNNLIYNNVGDGIAVTPIGGGTPSSDRNWLYSNTIYGNTGNCIIIGAFGTADNDKIINNICYANSSNTVYVTPGTVTNLTNQNNLFTNPNFVNAAGNDYHLQSSSAAINAGFTLGSPYNIDFDGNSRPSGAYDIGAYEH